MELVRVIEYSDIFPEEGQKKPAIENLIQGINRKHLCTLVANMFNRLVGKPFFDNNLDPRREEFDCVHFFLSPQNQQFIQEVLKRQLIKSICLFVYLFRDKRLKGLRRAFMAFYHMGNWFEYFEPHVMTIYLSEMKTGQLIVEGRSRIQRKSRRLIRQFSIQYDRIIPYDQNSDYSVFRAKPFI